MGLVTSGPEVELGNHSMRSLMVYFPVNQETALSCLRPIWKLNIAEPGEFEFTQPIWLQMHCPGLLGYLRSGYLGKPHYSLSLRSQGEAEERKHEVQAQIRSYLSPWTPASAWQDMGLPRHTNVLHLWTKPVSHCPFCLGCSMSVCECACFLPVIILKDAHANTHRRSVCILHICVSLFPALFGAPL